MKPSGSSPYIWGIYDFANSFASIIVSFYFSLFIVGELHKGDIWVSLPLAVTTIALLLTLPFLGSIADRMHRYKPTLFVTTMIAIASLFGMGLFGQAAVHHKGFFVPLLASYFLFQYFYQAGFAFYLPFIQELSQTGSRNFVASIGMAIGQMGNVVALLVIVPLTQAQINIAGITGIPLAFCMAAFFFLIFYIPFHIFFKETKGHSQEFYNFIPTKPKDLLLHLVELKKHPNVLRYLLAYYFFADAILTLQLFASLYLDKVGFLSTGLKTNAFVIGLIMAVVGAALTPVFIKKMGNLKKALASVLIVWSVLLVLLVLAQNHWQMVVIVGLNGIAFGMLFSLSRVMYSRLIPKDEPAKYFGLYVLFERFASILGPLVWSGSVAVFAFAGPINKYRIATAMLAVMVLIAYAIFRTVKEDYQSD